MTVDATIAGSLQAQRARYANGEVVLVLERPRVPADPREVAAGPLVVSGYALSRGGVQSVRVAVAGQAFEVPVERRRPEVRLSFLEPSRPRQEVGFELALAGDGWAPGSLSVQVSARDGEGRDAHAAVVTRWAPDRDRLVAELAGGRPLLWWRGPLSGEPPVGEFVVVRGIAAALGGEPRVTIALDGREVRPSLSSASPDVREWAARPLGVEPHNYQAILDLRGLAGGEAELSVTVEDRAGRSERRAGMLRVDPGARYRRWREAGIDARRPPSGDGRPIALEVWIDCNGADGAASTAAQPLLDSLALQDELPWSLRPLGAPPAATLASPAWRRWEEQGRVGEGAGGLHEALQGLADRELVAAVVARPQDALLPGALARIAERLTGDRAADLVYGDDERDAGDGHIVARLKPGWSPQLLLAGDYAGPLVAVAPGAARAALASGERIATVYELLVALADRECAVQRIPQALCRLGADDGAEARGDASGAIRALARRAGAEVEIAPVPGVPGLRSVRWPLRSTPLVSIVVITATRRQLLQTCLRSLRAHTDYPQLEVVLVDSGPGIAGAVADELLDGIEHRTVRYAAPQVAGPSFNYSIACNLGAQHSNGELLVFLNDDLEFVDPAWLRCMAEFGVLPDVGAVGVRMMWPGGLVQSCGVGGMRLELGEFPTDLLKGLEGSSSGPQHILTVAHERAAVIGGCMLVRRSALARVGGWDEAFPMDLGDWDLCMRLWAAGLRSVIVPWVSVIHFETSTRSLVREWSVLEGLAAQWRPLHRDGDPWLHPGLRAATYPSLDLDGDTL